MISSVSNNRPQAPQRQNFKGARMGLFYESSFRAAQNVREEYLVRTGINMDPAEAIARLERILKKGVANLSENLSIFDKPIGKKGSTKRIIRYSPDAFRNRAHRNENMFYAIDFSLSRKDFPEYKTAFKKLSAQLEAARTKNKNVKKCK